MPSISHASLSEKDAQFRDFALHGNMWKVILYIGLPLAMYQSLNQLFKVFDSMMAAHISSSSVSAVTYLSQINLMLSAIGTGLSIGAGMKISEAYGAGDYHLVKQRVSTLFAVCAILGGFLLAVLIPFAPQFLRMANTPEVFIAQGRWYFILELIALVIGFFNSIYIAVERCRGNSKRILNLNAVAITVKLSLTALFVYVFHFGITMIATATIASQSVLFLAAIINLSQKNDAFGFSIRSISFEKKVLMPMLLLAFPVILEKVAFSFGKVVVNSMSTVYSTLTVGALGISNQIDGFSTMPQDGFQEGGSSIISQNLGADQPQRALKAFRCVFIINVLIGIIFTIWSLAFIRPLAGLYAGKDLPFQEMIIAIYRFEAWGPAFLGATDAVLALLYGFGKTRISLFLNFTRIFIFRIPVLWYLQHFTDIGDISVGIVMAISNISTGILAIIISIIEIRKICKRYQISFWS